MRAAITGGTTELMITSARSSGRMPSRESWFQMSMPSSSEVRPVTVVSRKLPFRVSPSNTLNTILVLPTSMVSSIVVPSFLRSFTGPNLLNAEEGLPLPQLYDSVGPPAALTGARVHEVEPHEVPVQGNVGVAAE